jgi:hypothetical protein
MQKSKLSILISVLFLTFSFNSFAQTDSTQIDLSGKWALQFGISENFTLTNFQGGTISAKYHFNNNSALRFGVTLSQSNSDDENSITQIYPDTTYINSEASSYSNYQIRFSLQYIKYSKPINSIAMFYGGGVNYFTQPQERERLTEYIEPVESDYVDNSNHGFGVSILIGVEWFVRSNMGITAEYGAGYQYSVSESINGIYDITRDIKRNSKTTRTRYAFVPSSVKFGVSIYF